MDKTNWRRFVGASILAGGLMLKVAPVWAVAAGLALAGLVSWHRHRRDTSRVTFRP